jgi:protein TonB
MLIVAAVLALVAPVAAHYGGQAVHKVGEQGVKAPVVVKDVKPAYTRDARERGVQGSVEVDAVILTDGTVGDVTVKRSLDPGLDEEAVKATKQWRFRPGTKNGEAVSVQVSIELTFTLK